MHRKLTDGTTLSYRRFVVLFALILSAVLLLLLIMPVTAAPKTRYVDGTSGADSGDCATAAAPCETIAYALNKSFGGDTVKVALDTYKENLVFDDNVNLVGGFTAGSWDKQSDLHGTIIDGGGMESVVRYEGGFAGTLDGFKITGGKAEFGGGVFSEFGSPKLKNLRIEKNEATDSGGGVYFYMGQPQINDSQIVFNKAAKSGGGVFISNAKSDLSSLVISDNQAPDGAGISLSNTGKITLADSQMILNIAGNQSGAIHMENTDLKIDKSIIARNRAGDHGGAMTAVGSQLMVVNSLFVRNQTTAGPASVLAMEGSEVFVVNSTIADNAPAGHQAVLVWSGLFWLKNSIMWNNALNLQSDPPCPHNSCFKIEYSDVQGYTSSPIQDKGNIDADPLFRSPLGSDYKLNMNSPCINTGTANGVSYVPPDDLDGHARDAKPDMGAYEYYRPTLNLKISLPVVMAMK